ncbi:hydrolase [Pseudonocardia dioxanivorans CB1190]|uniref:Hydrolase n=2 Tax=Pseudonocardia dioxanivorans TaxID=240495 RepID=F4CYS9_PSEUX|nr:hydrolase [Pseudonocardia dioxanivorans CB1190]
MLKVHFLNVGHGDCTFVELPSGRLMMVDINNSKSLPEEDIEALAESKFLSKAAFELNLAATPAGVRSWEDYYESLLVDPVDYHRDNLRSQEIFRYIQTHPDLDHMSGLHRFFSQEKVALLNFWDTSNQKSLDTTDFTNAPYDALDWTTYQLLRLGHGPDDSTHVVINAYAGDLRDYWAQDGIEILSPTPDIVDTCNSSDSYNNISFVLRLSYAGRSIILPGDAEGLAWKSMLSSFPDSLPCDVLKASHHGRESGYDYDAVAAMSPSAVICSVGKKPSTDASDEYASHGAKVFSTRYHGTITVTINAYGEIWIDDRNGARLLTL